MKIKDLLQISVASLILMAYGWYLGGLHQSGPDIAGILLFITGAAGLILTFIIHHFTRKYSWHNRWFMNILTGVISYVIILVVVTK